MAFDFYKNTDEADLAALIVYLRTLEAVAFAGKSQRRGATPRDRSPTFLVRGNAPDNERLPH